MGGGLTAMNQIVGQHKKKRNLFGFAFYAYFYSFSCFIQEFVLRHW